MKKRIFLTLVFTVMAISSLFAQTDPGLPCGGGDIDDVACPLDTWVVVLAVIAMVFTTIHLIRKQKAALNAA